MLKLTFLAIVLAFLSIVISDPLPPCEEGTFVFHKLSKDSVWGFQNEDITVHGCGFKNKDYPYLMIELNYVECDIKEETITSTSFVCTTRKSVRSHGWGPIAISLGSNFDNNTDNSIFLLENFAFRYVNPQFQSVIPRNVASTAGSSIRISISDIPIEPKYEVTLGGIPATFISMTDHFIIVSAGITHDPLPDDDSIEIKTVDGLVVYKKSMSFNYYTVENERPYISSTSPSWLPIMKTYQPIHVSGHNFKNLENVKIRFSNPDNYEDIFCHDMTPIEDDIRCSLPPLEFSYVGSVTFTILSGDAAVASFEMEFVTLPTVRFMLPGNDIPVNKSVFMRVYMDNFPLNVPVVIRFPNNNAVTHTDYTIHSDGISFQLPDCTKGTNQCVTPFIEDVILTNEIDGVTAVNLGSFTYSNPQQGAAVTSVFPLSAYFDDGKYFNIYGWGFHDLPDSSIAKVRLVRVGTTETLLASLEGKVQDSTIRFVLPPVCVDNPGACRDGAYLIDLFDDEGRPVTKNEVTMVKLVNNAHEAISAVYHLLEPYDAAQEKDTTQRVIDAFVESVSILGDHRLHGVGTFAVAPKIQLALENMISISTSPATPLEKLKMNIAGQNDDNINNGVKFENIGESNISASNTNTTDFSDVTTTFVQIIFKPLGDNIEPTAAQLHDLVAAIINQIDHPIYLLLPTLDKSPKLHTKTVVKYCETLKAYVVNCKSEDDDVTPDNSWIKYLLIAIFLVAVILVIGIVVYRKKKNRTKVDNSIALIDDHASFYNQLN